MPLLIVEDHSRMVGIKGTTMTRKVSILCLRRCKLLQNSRSTMSEEPSVVSNRVITYDFFKDEAPPSVQFFTPSKPLTVLIVDDARVERFLHSGHFRCYGIEATAVENGLEAVNLIESGMKFDLILMDHRMPVMRGATAAKIMRLKGVESIIVGLTTTYGSDREKFIEAGIDIFYPKPLTCRGLNRVMRYIEENM